MTWKCFQIMTFTWSRHQRYYGNTFYLSALLWEMFSKSLKSTDSPWGSWSVFVFLANLKKQMWVNLWHLLIPHRKCAKTCRWQKIRRIERKRKEIIVFIVYFSVFPDFQLIKKKNIPQGMMLQFLCCKNSVIKIIRHPNGSAWMWINL